MTREIWSGQVIYQIQAYLSKDLVMDGETYGNVKSFFDGDGGADLVATAGIRNGLMKFQEILPFLTSRVLPLERKSRVYARCVRLIFENKTRLLLADVRLRFERAYIQMIIWMCGVSIKD